MIKNTYFLIIILLVSFSLTGQNKIIGENPYSNFGNVIAMSGNGQRIITSSSKSKKCGVNCGQIKVYEFNDKIWTQVGKTILGDNSGNYFGSAVDISEDGLRIIISSPHNKEKGYASGKVKIYEWKNNQWSQLGQSLFGIEKDLFGSEVTISGDGSHIAISAPFSQNNDFVRVYKWFNNKWIKKGNDLKGNLNSEYYGSSISLSHNGFRLAIGIHNSTGIGKVKVYDFLKNKWNQKGSDIIAKKTGNGFAWNLSLSGNSCRIAIGIPKENHEGKPQTGAVKIFDFNGKEWKKIGNSIYGENPYDLFGQSIDISFKGNRFIASSIFSDINGVNSGQIRVFEYDTQIWKQIYGNINGENKRDYFGKSVSISSDGNRISVSSTQEWVGKQGKGKIQIFDIKK